MAIETEVITNLYMWYWNYGLLGHGKRDSPTNTPYKGKNSGQSTTTKGDTTTTNKGQQKNIQCGHIPLKCTCAPCSWIGHLEDKYCVKNLELKPQSFTLEVAQGRRSNSRGNSLEACMGELQNTLALLVVVTTKSTPISFDSNLGLDRFDYGAIGEVVAAMATRSHTNSMLVAPVMQENIATQGGPHESHQGPLDSIRQSRLSLTFGLVDVVNDPSFGVVSNRGDSPKEKDRVKDLALKLLEVPLFSRIQLHSDNFNAIVVYHMARKIMQGIV